ncbi:MAG: DUF3169 family protein [Longicatena sp.]
MNSRRKAFYRYLWITVISAIIGGVAGYMGMISRESDWNYEGVLKTIPVFLCTLLLIVIVVLMIITIIKYFKAKKYVKLSNDEDEEIYLLADKELSMVSSLNTIGQIVGMISIGLVIPMMIFWEPNDSKFIGIYSMILGMAVVVAFILYVIISTCLQVKTVDLIKKIYPEKKGYALEKKFEDVWLESADENERKKIGEASYYSFRITQKWFSWIMVIALFIGMFLPESYIFIILIGTVWIVQTISYLKKSRELEFKRK